jgi:L-fuculose-phosphate aldolase
VRLADEREALAAWGRRMQADGLVCGSAGNLSVRAGEVIAITPSGVDYEEIEPADICLIDLDGNRLEGARPSSELPLHTAVYRATRAKAVVHTHSAMVTAVSTVAEELPAIHYSVVQLGGPVRVAGYQTYGSEELANGAVEAMAGRSAVILANHGCITYAGTLLQAYRRAELLEWLSSVYWHARMLGEPRILSERQLADVVDQARRLADRADRADRADGADGADGGRR